MYTEAEVYQRLSKTSLTTESRSKPLALSAKQPLDITGQSDIVGRTMTCASVLRQTRRAGAQKLRLRGLLTLLLSDLGQALCPL